MTLFKRICDCFQWVMSVKLSSSQSKSMMSIQLRVSIVHSNKVHKAKARLCKDYQMACVIHGTWLSAMPPSACNVKSRDWHQADAKAAKQCQQ